MRRKIVQFEGGDRAFLRRKTKPAYESGASPIRLVDLFSGSGGLTLGVAEACRSAGRGLEVRLAMELDARIRSIYDLNFKSSVSNERGDVCRRFDQRMGQELSSAERLTKAEVGAVDVLVGGPPCQGHSALNNHTRGRDEKNELYLVMARAAEVLRPAHVIVENVLGVRQDQSDVLERAKKAFNRLGYHVDEGIVRMVDLGVPQKRVRHILVAAQEHPVDGILDFEALDRPRPLRWAINDLQGIEPAGVFDKSAILSAENKARAQYLLDKDLYDLPNEYRPACHRDKPDHRYTAMYGRLAWDEPAHTITTGFGSPGQGRHLHPAEPRTLTPHEAARVQFLPDWFRFGEDVKRGVLAHCIGNAVPPKLAFSVLCRMRQRASAVTSSTASIRLGAVNGPNVPVQQSGQAA